VTTQPSVGASVSIPTLRVGGFTDDAGRYSFTAPASVTGTAVTVIARRLGYLPSSAPVTLTGAPVTQNFSLSPSATELQGIVVTALGLTREKSRIGTAQQQLTSAEINQTKALNVVEQLEGKVSGVTITGASTQGGSANIIIRGANSITGNNQPVFIVDGVPTKLALIRGTEGPDILKGTRGTDRIEGLGADDTLSGGRDNDVLLGGAGEDAGADGGAVAEADADERDVLDDVLVGDDVAARVDDDAGAHAVDAALRGCLLDTSDAADDPLCVDLGGRRIIKKKPTPHPRAPTPPHQPRTLHRLHASASSRHPPSLPSRRRLHP